ncbi:MAG: PEP-CTERM sorting domain-containing protein [Verrucomicrobiales bacterium]|jgi:hypothetical protein|nr:PEP-CTERM sorting domain-containing protein [Verrucomicrobiales bacterium]
MKLPPFTAVALGATALLTLSAAPVRALTIQIDYTYDTGGFFDDNTLARASLERAAADLSYWLSPTTLTALDTGVTFSATSGNGLASYEVTLGGLNIYSPSGNGTITVSGASLAANTFTVYAGAQALDGNTLGMGGTAWWEISANFNYYSGGDDSLPEAAAAVAAQFNAAALRHAGGPVTGEWTINDAALLQYGLWGGAVWFDTDGTDWHFDWQTEVTAGASDFYSVALHELFHTLTIGTTWNSLVDDDNRWLGDNAAGTLMEDGAAHFAEGVMSIDLLTQLAQETAMDPTLTYGTRKYLTVLDLALLQDLGFAVIPEPSTYALLGLGAGVLVVGLLRGRRRPGGANPLLAPKQSSLTMPLASANSPSVKGWTPDGGRGSSAFGALSPATLNYPVGLRRHPFTEGELISSKNSGHEDAKPQSFCNFAG